MKYSFIGVSLPQLFFFCLKKNFYLFVIFYTKEKDLTLEIKKEI